MERLLAVAQRAESARALVTDYATSLSALCRDLSHLKSLDVADRADYLTPEDWHLVHRMELLIGQVEKGFKRMGGKFHDYHEQRNRASSFSPEEGVRRDAYAWYALLCDAFADAKRHRNLGALNAELATVLRDPLHFGHIREDSRRLVLEKAKELAPALFRRGGEDRKKVSDAAKETLEVLLDSEGIDASTIAYFVRSLREGRNRAPIPTGTLLLSKATRAEVEALKRT